MKNKGLYFILAAVIVLLSIPFFAMQFTGEVNWELNDFAVMGGLLLAVGLAIEFVLRKFPKTKHRIGIILAILLVFFLIWAELAVGIFGTPFAGT